MGKVNRNCGMSADIKNFRDEYMQFQDKWDYEKDEGKKKEMKVEVDKMKEALYRMKGECEKGDITFCKKNENC